MRPTDLDRLIKRMQTQATDCLDQRVYATLSEAASKDESSPSAAPRPRVWTIVVRSRITQAAAAAVILIGIGVLARHLTGNPDIPGQQGLDQIAVRPAETGTTRSEVQDQHLTAELALAGRLFAKADIPGLIDLLEKGLAQTEVKVAGYLAELNARQAVPALQRLASSWTGDPNANPFAQAVERINASNEEPNTSSAGEVAAKAPATSAVRALRFQVVDKVTGQPLPGAIVKAEQILPVGVEPVEYVTDANGCCRIDMTDPNKRQIHVAASRPGYVGMCRGFMDPNERAFSKTHILALAHGTVIGGIVQDANGLPIEGATVSVTIHDMHEDYAEPNVCVQFKQKTDPAGRWSCDMVPADLLGLLDEGQFGFGVDHSDYASGGCDLRDASTVESLRSLTLPITLHKGFTFRGRLVGLGGEPIAGARVEGRYLSGPDGRFEIPHVLPDRTSIWLGIEASGYPKMDKEVKCRTEGETEIILHPGYMLHGRVVDKKNTPVAGADIIVWCAHYGHPWGSTDEKGMFAVGPIPVDANSVHVQKSGYWTARLPELKGPTDESLEFVLYRILPPASGSVFDATTGRPIERFTVTPGLVSPTGKVFFDAQHVIVYPGKAGHYECHFDCIISPFPNSPYVVIVEADGYLPAESRAIDPEEGAVVIDIALTPGTGPAGTVVDTNGLPVASAFVYSVAGNDKVAYDGSVPVWFRQFGRIKTGDDGRFSFEPLYQLRRLLALADQGICSMTVDDLKVSGSMVLQPWAEVRGAVHSPSGGPTRNLPIEAASLPEAPERSGYKWSLSANTDDQGTFQIKRVPPGEFTLLGKTYQVAPGQVLNLDLSVDPNGPADHGTGP